jgi:hypothetical protein
MKKIALVFVLLFAVAPLFAHDSKTCTMKDKKAAGAKSSDEGKSVDLTGKVLCNHCDLHKTKSCENVFQSSDQKVTYRVCEGSSANIDELKESKETYRVKGTLIHCAKDGVEEIVIDEATKVDESKKG